MRILAAAIGRLKDAGEKDLFARYAERLDGVGRGVALGPLRVVELPESRAASAEARKADEAQRLLKASAGADARVALDERGKLMSSEDFAAWLRDRRDGGVGTLAFLLGGPDGHGPELLSATALTLSLGPLTLPHGLARVVLAEQLYRAATIFAGHPYHRAFRS
jgi:23S rRNA (pseudouridine1915-N3)-methyltransferase